jgi:hypothetical protein
MPGLSRSDHERNTSKDQGALDASILSQSRNQAKRGPSKRPRRFRVMGEAGRNLSSAPMRDAKDFAGVFSKWT